MAQSIERSAINRKCVRCDSEHEVFRILVTPLITVRRMPMELHALKHEVPGSNPGGSKCGHSSMVEHEVSSRPCRRRLHRPRHCTGALYSSSVTGFSQTTLPAPL